MPADSLLPGNNTAQSEESHEDSRLSCVETFPHPDQMTANNKKRRSQNNGLKRGLSLKKYLQNFKAMHYLVEQTGLFAKKISSKYITPPHFQ